MKRLILILFTGLLLVLTACKNGKTDTLTLYEGKAVKITQKGDITHIYDLIGNSEYTFKKHPVKMPKDEKEPVKEATEHTSTNTIDIKTVHGLIIVTGADGKTLYID